MIVVVPLTFSTLDTDTPITQLDLLTEGLDNLSCPRVRRGKRTLHARGNRHQPFTLPRPVSVLCAVRHVASIKALKTSHATLHSTLMMLMIHRVLALAA